MASSQKTTPKDALVMSAILKDMGVIEYEQRVINQMLEFTYRYVTSILDDARLFSSHAKKKLVDIDDVRLAIQLQMDKSFTSPPPRDLLIEVARQKNSIAMPLIKANVGPRLPPDRYSLTSSNYRMKSMKKPRSSSNHSTSSRLNLSSMQGGNLGSSKSNAALSLSSKSGATLSVVSKGGASVAVSSRPQSKSAGKSAPTPIIKLSSGPPAIRTSISSGPMATMQLNKPSDDLNRVNASSINSNKRKIEEFVDDYDNE